MFSILRIKMMTNVDNIAAYLNDADSGIRKAAMNRLDMLVTDRAKKLPILTRALGNSYFHVRQWTIKEIDKLDIAAQQRAEIHISATISQHLDVRSWAVQRLTGLEQTPRIVKTIADYQVAEAIRNQMPDRYGSFDGEVVGNYRWVKEKGDPGDEGGGPVDVGGTWAIYPRIDPSPDYTPAHWEKIEP